MKRHHLIEFEDLEKFPAKVRDGITDYLRFFISLFRIYSPIPAILKEYMEITGNIEILDLCSGSGGATIQLINELDKLSGKKYKITQSDKYPNLKSLEFIKQRTCGRIGYIGISVDATNVPENFHGFRTIFSSFHHFKNDDAVKVLQNAVDCNSPIGIFDGAERKWRYIIGVILSTPFFLIFCSPFFKPFKWSRIFLTYIIPLIPIFAVWDGIVSMLRIYNPNELIELAKQTNSKNYIWNSGTLKNKIGTRVSYLVGYPK